MSKNAQLIGFVIEIAQINKTTGLNHPLEVNEMTDQSRAIRWNYSVPTNDESWLNSYYTCHEAYMKYEFLVFAARLLLSRESHKQLFPDEKLPSLSKQGAWRYWRMWNTVLSSHCD